ncbi:MAG: GxxExxY protein [Sediminibacterium sp.]|nr:GxxExxY protein [Sediminibacterium sp.]
MELLFKEYSYAIIGACMEVHKYLGPGFLEVVYKDAIEIELMRTGIYFEREKKYEVMYKGNKLQHFYVADFVVEGVVILEVKAAAAVSPVFVAQTINYLKVSGNKLGLLINFGETQLMVKRLVL